MKGATRPPIKESDPNGCLTYDSVVTNVEGQVHREFITFAGGAVYPEYVVKFKYITFYPPGAVVWVKISGLPWWPAKVAVWSELPEETQKALASKKSKLGQGGGPVKFVFDSTLTYEFLPKDKVVPWADGQALGYSRQSGKGTGVKFHEAVNGASVATRAE